MLPLSKIVSALQILAGPILAGLAASTLWLLVVQTRPSSQTSTLTYSLTDIYPQLLDQWTTLCGHFENLRRLFDIIRSGNLSSYLASLIHKPQARQNIGLIVFIIICYFTAIVLIRKNQDHLSRTWSLRLVMGALVSAHLFLLSNILWTKFLPIWIFVVNTLLQSLYWDWWSKVGDEMREKFYMARLRSVGFKFAGIINEGQEKNVPSREVC
jgi:hypothetical protein